MCVRARGKQGAVALLSRAGGIAHDALRWLDERGRSSVWLEHSTVTREVAGSSPVAPVTAVLSRWNRESLEFSRCRSRQQECCLGLPSWWNW